MKTFQIFIIILFSTVSVFCQEDFDHLLVKRQVDCSDISYNSGLYFAKYMNENKIDSAKSILNYWESKCGKREPIFRAKILLSLKTGKFNDSLLIDGGFNNIYNYQRRMDMIKCSEYYSYDNYKSYFGFIPPGQEFDKFTQELASEVKNNYNTESTEYLLAELYSDNYDTILAKIQTKPYEGSILAEEYNTIVKRFVNMAEGHFSWITGVWIPTGNLKKLGVHPELGFQIGFKHKRMNYDFTMTAKFLNTPNEYYAKRNNTLESTDHFFGAYLGIDVGYDLIARNGHELQVTTGIAFDGFDVLKEDEDRDLDAKSVCSYNFSAGLEYRYYITNSFYLGLRAKYNIVDYTLNDVIDFTGNPVTIQFIIGGVNNVNRNYNLKTLKYKLRK